ncbi:hypothetical protein [Neobacillus sp. PS3-40]|jgi:hypothetical protein|uniref:hypothetical protein n=1 Tax=Neobacillus sp. PS3-40 TaxID=3070679 RepID=UPI0027E14855|nr:hypothetical protein [Neobacillus sp. PS3-40]WML43568.1 hypothetical protein RCG20_17490 [Neobacillus sp. PS3-40]
MKTLQDALYNWLTIKIVSNARPDDSAARETTELFEEILLSKFGATDLKITKDKTLYRVSYKHEGEVKENRFPIVLADFTLEQINENPERYVNYPVED